MAKQKTTSAKLTNELPGITKKRGRPFTGNAKTNAQRQAEFRARRQGAQMDVLGMALGLSGVSVVGLAEYMQGDNAEMVLAAWTELGRRNGYLK